MVHPKVPVLMITLQGQDRGLLQLATTVTLLELRFSTNNRTEGVHGLRRGSEAREALDRTEKVNVKKNNSNMTILCTLETYSYLTSVRELKFPFQHQTLHIAFICPCPFSLLCGTVDSAV